MSIDTEKIPDGPYSKKIFSGIEVSSRYGKSTELRNMTAALARLPLHLMRQVKSIWCDSKAYQCFSVYLDSENLDGCVEIGRLLDEAFMDVCGGHNGITFYAGTEIFENEIFDIDPNWEG
jgi:hypothetical protein